MAAEWTDEPLEGPDEYVEELSDEAERLRNRWHDARYWEQAGATERHSQRELERAARTAFKAYQRAALEHLRALARSVGVDEGEYGSIPVGDGGDDT